MFQWAHHTLLQGYRFEVSIGNKNRFGFKSVDGLKLTAAYEPLAVGGRNDGPVLLRVPVKNAGKLTFERGKYYVISGQSLNFRPGQTLAKSMSIRILDDSGKPRVTYNVNNPMLESIELSKLDATNSSVLIEKLTIVHQGISAV